MFKKILLITGLIIFLLVGGFAIYIGSQVYTAWNQIHVEREGDMADSEGEENEAVEVSMSEPFTMLVMGIDDEDQGTLQGRSDAMMVAVVDPEQEEMSLLSIPRDTYTQLAHDGRHDKINHAYAYGGRDSAISTVENFLDIPIDYYVALNFDAFRDTIDVMGGLEVDVEREIFHNYTRETILTEGRQTLNGKEALRYVRFRSDAENDFGRMRRQQQVVDELLNQSLDLRNVTRMTDILGVAGENIETDMPFRSMVSLASNLSSLTGENMNSITMSGTGERIEGVDYVMVTEEEQQRVQNELKAALDRSVAKEDDEHEDNAHEDNAHEDGVKNGVETSDTKKGAETSHEGNDRDF